MVSLSSVWFWKVEPRGLGRSYPIESHIRGILKDIMIGMAQDVDIAVTGGAFGAEIAQRMFRMGRVASQSHVNLPVHDNVNLYASLCLAFEDLIQAKLLIVVGSPKKLAVCLGDPTWRRLNEKCRLPVARMEGKRKETSQIFYRVLNGQTFT